MTKLKVIPGGRETADAFHELVEPHFAALYRCAFRMSRNAADAEDLVQDVCVRAYPRLSTLAQMENPRAWLLRVLYRLFVDLTRRRQASPLQPMNTMEEENCSADMACPEPGPDAQADSAIGEARLERAWQQLDKVQQALLAMHGIEGYSLAELEQMSGLPQGTLKSRLHRARIRLGKLLKSETMALSRPTAQEI